MTGNQQDTEPQVLARLPRTDDLEVHLRLVDVDGEVFVELRQYVISLKKYGRGVWLHKDPEVLTMLRDAIDRLLKQ